jgi:drug/metabolite transporter (DMT)-like permease
MVIKEKPHELFVLLILNLAVMLWGFSALFGKIVEADAYNLTFWRMAIAWVALAGLYIYRHKIVLPQWNRSLAWKNMLCAILLAVHWVAFFKVVQMSSVALAIVFHASFVFMVAVIEPFIVKEKPQIRTIAVAVVGSAALITTMLFQVESASSIVWLYGFLVAAGYAAVSLLNRTILIEHDTLDCMTGQFFYGALFLLPLTFLGVTDFFVLSVESWLKIAVLGVFTTALGHSIYFWSLRHVSATKASTLSMMEPAYGILFAVLFLGEYPDQAMFIGAVIVVLCAVAVAFTTVAKALKEDERL